MKKIIPTILITAILFYGTFFFAPEEADAVWLSDYTYRVEITIDNTKVDATLTNFPVAVMFSSSTMDFSHFKDDGYDVRFTSNDEETLIDFERERWASTTDGAVLWVEVPSVSSTTDTTFYMYYGKADATDVASSTAVWDSNFKMVQHLKDNTTSQVLDSTVNNYDGTKISANNPIEIDGKIGKGQDFSSDHINCGSVGTPTIYTIETWIKADALGGAGDLNTYGNTILSPSSLYGCWMTVGKGGGTEVTLRAFSSSVTGHNSSGANLNTADWFYIVALATKNSTAKVYINGVEKLSFTADDIAWAGNLTIGDLRPNRAIYFDGIIDEVRLSDNIRTPAWIKASYNSGNDSLLSIGSEEEEEVPAEGKGYIRIDNGRIKINKGRLIIN